MLQPPRSHARRAQRRLPAPVRFVGTALSHLLLWTCVLAALVLLVVPFATGSQTYAVLTSSMAPGYPPGTLIVVKPQPYESLEVGDVVTYQLESGKPAVITHRITGFASDQAGNRMLVTKGDNNDVADPEPVREVQVRGTLFYAVPYAGYLANALGRTDRGALLNVVAFALIGYGAITVGLGARGRRLAGESSRGNGGSR
ncbi:hypothetical protein GCM10028820_06180 [Tessaracoccus terricola]